MSSSTQQPDAAPTCNTRDMVLVHEVYRHMFADAPPLVRGVAAGDVTRAGIVGPHVRSIVENLHRHHHTEDELLWDTLEQRSPGCAMHVALMKSHHAAVAELIEQVEAALPSWQESAGTAERDHVADLVEQIRAALEIHLGKEEELILPVASTAMSQEEWDRLGEHAQRDVPNSEKLLQLGWIVDALGPEVGGQFMREAVPLPVRVIWSVIGKRQFARHRRLVLGS